MALSSLCLRRALTSSSLSRNRFLVFSIPNASSPSSSSSSALQKHHISSSTTANVFQNYNLHFPSNIQAHSFRSSSLSLSSSRSFNDDEKISPDTILFEGCDYNHWLITMEFPKDPKPTPEEMVETYVQTLAKVVGSVEEAKKRMYACSTTTYNGFQAVMTEEMSEKFRGLPGVVFILPDSYIDPVNKEYGGDKYINGTIIPRPPPVQYGRSQGRYGDRNRNYDRPRYDRQREPMPMQQGNPPYDHRGPMQGDGRNLGVQQNYAPQQNFAPTGQGERRDSMPMGNRDYGAQQNYAPQQNYGPTGQGERRDSTPMGNRDYGAQQNYAPQQNHGPTGQVERRDSMPMGNRDYIPGGRDAYQGERRDAMPSYQRDYNQGERGNNFSQERRDFPQGERRDYGTPEHGDFRGDNKNFAPSRGGDHGQGAGSGYGQNYPVHGEGQSFSQSEQRGGVRGEQSNYAPVGQTGTDQGRY